ncbi:MAG: 50S ribosomal protein L11 methyltransferase [Bacteroidota bacterium]
MSYIQLEFEFDPGKFDPEILMAYLGELGYESFVDHDKGLTAYIHEGDFSENLLKNLLKEELAGFSTQYTFKELPKENWNATWESNFPAVVIASQCRVRAPFHEADPAFPLEIIIEPKMSFGTAHHETTSLVMELLLNEPPVGLSVLDMGCGTGILAILSAKLQASSVLAIDNDEWAYLNSIENVERNETLLVEVLQGDASLLGTRNFDLIIANINRNILLEDINKYAKVLKQGGRLILSGFYEKDLALISKETDRHGISLSGHLVKNNWVAAEFAKLKY